MNARFWLRGVMVGIIGWLASVIPVRLLGKRYFSSFDGKDEQKVAAQGYDYLRTSLELLVANTIFKDIVGRYRSNIRMTLLPTINGVKIDEHKPEIDTMFSRACRFIAAHSHPEEQHAPPTMNDLKTDFARFKVIASDFNN